MMRKVVKHGPSTLIISIPSNWAKLNNISKGSELDVLEEGKRLIVNTDASDGQKPLEVNLDITGLDRTSIMYAIRSLYRLGYDTVNVRFDIPTTEYYKTGEKLNVISVIHTEVNRLIGFEIIEEKEKSCVIKDMEAVSMRDFDNVMRRIFLLVLDTSNDFVEGAKTLNASLLETIEEKHDTITKFASYCLRLLNKKGHYIQMKTAYQYHIIALLDKVADILKYAARDVRTNNKRLSPKVVKLLEAVCKHLRMYYEFFYKYDKAKVIELGKSRYDINRMLQDCRMLCNVCIAIAQSDKAPRIQAHAGKEPDYVVTSEILLAANFSYVTEIVLDLTEARIALEYATGPQ
ncbi:phosphate uptake regulator PhoU [Candidatus Woesearchaeota archaeon]|nr:phosphate uptake regulator PhoU [Candidatus Woesearchaeota archaeon]